MQKLHLVGFTPDLDGLILSTRKGAKSGSFVVRVDPALLAQLGTTQAAPAARTNGVRSHGPRQSRPESQLGPREMQELLRAGWTLEEVAVEAGVDVDWVSRFATPVLAEMRLVLDQALECVFEKPRVGPSALPLAASVRRNAAERGVRFTDEDFDEAWRAHQVDEQLWIVGFDYTSRGKTQSAEWMIDLETNELISQGRLGTQLGHVQSARRKVDLTPPPKPKPKAAASRAMRAPAEPPPAPPGRRATTPPKATAPAKRARGRTPASRSSSGTKKATGGAKASKPHPAAQQPVPTPAKTSAARSTVRDPWREELRRREKEQSAARPVSAPSPTPTPATPAATEHDLRPVAIIGPTVRTLARRRPAPRPAPAPPPVPVDEPIEELPDLQWSPRFNAGTHGPLPAPAPLPVPEEVRERVESPLGLFEDDSDVLDLDALLGPVRPVFRGAQSAMPPEPESAPAASPARRRRTEPLRAR